MKRIAASVAAALALIIIPSPFFYGKRVVTTKYDTSKQMNRTSITSTAEELTAMPPDNTELSLQEVTSLLRKTLDKQNSILPNISVSISHDTPNVKTSQMFHTGGNSTSTPINSTHVVEQSGDAIPPKSLCTLIRIKKDGAVSIVKPSIRGHMIHESVFLALKQRVQDAVKEYGPLTMMSDSLLFDISTPDVPNCGEEGEKPMVKTCQEMINKKRSNGECCGKDGELSSRSLPLIGISNNICCECSMPLPLHANQMPVSLRGDLQFNDPFSWEQKKRLAVWRGGGTGHFYHTTIYTRFFREIAKQKNGTLSAQLRNSSSDWWPDTMNETPRKRIVNISKHNQTLLDASFGKIPWKDLAKYKYIVSVSGNAYAGILKPALLSRSCVIRQDSIAKEWYEKYLQEWVHFIPVLYDLSDLEEKIKWAMEHDEECKKIGENGREFALRHFSEKAVNSFVHKAISNETHMYSW